MKSKLNKSNIDSFVHTIPIKTELYSDNILNNKLNISRMFYNRLLRIILEAEERIKLNKNYLTGMLIYKKRKKNKADIEDYNRLFKLARKVDSLK